MGRSGRGQRSCEGLADSEEREKRVGWWAGPTVALWAAGMFAQCQATAFQFAVSSKYFSKSIRNLKGIVGDFF